MNRIIVLLIGAAVSFFIYSCSSTNPEEQLENFIFEGYEKTNGSFDNSPEEDKLKELVTKLKEDGAELGRREIMRAWKAASMKYWTNQMTECLKENAENITAEDLTKSKGLCNNVTQRILKDYGRKLDAAERLQSINEAAFENWKASK